MNYKFNHIVDIKNFEYQVVFIIINQNLMWPAFQIIIALTIGTVITVNGVVARADDILASAKQAANVVNIHQLSIALELYYLDHNAYPDANNGSGLVSILYSGHYIKSLPTDPSMFAYQPIASGNDYDLSLK